MKAKAILLAITVIILCSVLPLVASAADISWLTEDYYVYAWVSETGYGIVENEDFGPPLPIDAEAYGPSSGCPEAYSQITSSLMRVVAASGSCGDAEARASFSGTFEAAMPLFLFDYSSSSVVGGAIQNLIVSDNGTEIFNDFLLSSGSVSLAIPITVGNTIEVEYSMGAWSSGSYADNTTTNYSMSVVPEPVSATLFIIGSATMGFRMYRKKRTV